MGAQLWLMDQVVVWNFAIELCGVRLMCAYQCGQGRGSSCWLYSDDSHCNAGVKKVWWAGYRAWGFRVCAGGAGGVNPPVAAWITGGVLSADV
jgi:hypothetical protein